MRIQASSRFIVGMAAFALSVQPLLAIQSHKAAVTSAKQTVKEQTPANSISVANMDKTTAPCQDFYQYANGTWLKKTEIPADYSAWGVFNILNEKSLAQLRTIMESAAGNTKAATGSIEKKLGDFYAVGMDEKKIEADGIKPLEPELQRIQAMKDTKDLQNEITRLHKMGINAAFGFGSGQDFKDSTQVIGQAAQGGLGLPERDYYTNTDESSKKIRDQYVAHIAKMLTLAGTEPAKAEATAKRILAFETKLAEASMTNTDLRDPEKIYHKMTIAQLNDLTPHFIWTQYSADLGFPSINEINVGEPDFFKQFETQISTLPLDEWKEYLSWRLLSDAAPFLSNNFVEEKFNFDGKILQGKKQNLPRWKRVIQTADHEMGQALGQVYVKTAFSPQAKARALDLVSKLKAQFREDLGKLDWMSADTKKNALAKLDKFTQKIGYPDKWRDYSGLKIERDSYAANVFRAEEFEFKRQLAKIGKPVDRTEWLMNPQTVNAYYMAEMNEIVFPAAILQPPFFNPSADDATNLGSIGMIIGHEMTHGFDDEGSKFDGSGNLKDWWTAEDKKHFQERVDHIVNQFDQYTVAGDAKIKGKLVSGEAAADLGGVTIAYKALEKSLGDKPRVKDANGFTPEQRFFIAFAQAWMQNTRPERMRLMAKTDPHPLAKLRVNGTVANMDAFVKAFGCAQDAPIMLPADKRTHLW